jgi:hypothetical protein
MHLRVTTESDTYVYATSPLHIAGLDPEDFIILLFPMAVLNTFDVQPLVSTLSGAFCLWLYKSMTADKPKGFLPIMLSLWATSLLNTRFVQNNKPLRSLVQALVKTINTIWIKNGLLPLPGYCNSFER